MTIPIIPIIIMENAIWSDSDDAISWDTVSNSPAEICDMSSSANTIHHSNEIHVLEYKG